MRIGLDIMGGDYAPMAPLQGVDLAMAVLPPGVTLCLLGDESVIREFIEQHSLPADRVEVIATTQVIEMGESPTKAMAAKPDSSILRGLMMLKNGELDMFISSGNTGAVYVGSLYTVKAIPGIQRPALTSLIPKENGGTGLIMDVGANADVKPEILVQFAMLGQSYMRSFFNIESPRVGLMNIGSEPEKGNLLTQAAYPMLKADPNVNFIGNVEGYDLFSDDVDVIVCDGFTGNIVLKTAETVYHVMKRRGLTDEYFQRFDYETYGGTPILGINKPVMVMHGVSSPQAYCSALLAAVHAVESHYIDNIKAALASGSAVLKS